MSAEQVIADALHTCDDDITMCMWTHNGSRCVSRQGAEETAKRAVAALRDAGEVSVPVEALRTVLNQQQLHAHERLGIWDWDNGPRANKPCEECAARADLAARLDSQP